MGTNWAGPLTVDWDGERIWYNGEPHKLVASASSAGVYADPQIEFGDLPKTTGEFAELCGFDGAGDFVYTPSEYQQLVRTTIERLASLGKLNELNRYAYVKNDTGGEGFGGPCWWEPPCSSPKETERDPEDDLALDFYKINFENQEEYGTEPA